jgi:hypothetical protein
MMKAPHPNRTDATKIIVSTASFDLPATRTAIADSMINDITKTKIRHAKEIDSCKKFMNVILV